MALAPMAAAAPAAPDPDMDADADMGGEGAEQAVLVTICKDGQGGYVVYSGDEPEGDEGEGMSADDAGAMGGAPGGAQGGPPAGGADMGGGAQGQPAASIGATLKITMDLLQADASSTGAPGSAEDQFQSGFTGGGAAGGMG